MRVSVVTPSLNKSFKFQSDWPYNNSQVYLLNSVLEDLKEDDERTFESIDDDYVYTSKVNYPNNKQLVKQNVYIDKNSKINKVEVTDKDNNVLIAMNYNKVEYDKKFDNNYFELSSIIKSVDEDEKNSNVDDKKKSVDEDNSNVSNDTSGTSDKEDDSVDDQSNTDTKLEEDNASNEKDANNEVDTTASINDIIYPMYLPDNTYLTSQEKINTDSGERLILTFGGDNSFILIEETIAASSDNLVIPVNGEFDFLADVIGVIGTNSVMWHSNGIEYYMTSNTLETSVLVDIARSISVLPVSK